MSIKTLIPEAPTRFAVQGNFVLFGVLFRTNMAVKTRLEVLCELTNQMLYMVNVHYTLNKTSVIFVHLMVL